MSILTQKEARRVLIVASEHAENVTIIVCDNAFNTSIFLQITLYKEKKLSLNKQTLPHWYKTYDVSERKRYDECICLRERAFCKIQVKHRTGTYLL